MKRSTWITLGVVVIVIGLALLLFTPLPGVTRETDSRSFSDVAAIEFDLENSPIEFSVGGDTVEVSYTYSTGLLGTAEVTFDQDGDTLRLRQDCTWFLLSFGCSASFDLTLPVDAEIRGTTSNGRIEVSGVEGPVDVSTSNGPVTLERVAGPVQVRTSNGGITGESLETGEIDVATSNGRVTLAFSTAPDLVAVRSSNGAVEILLPGDAPPYSLDTSTSNGTVATDIRTDPASSSSMSIVTSNGDITVGYAD